MMSVWTWILIKMESYWSWIPRKISSQCHNKPVLVPLNKPLDPVMDLYGCNTYGLKTSVDIWTSMDVVLAEYGIFDQMFFLNTNPFS